jgi:hypothetical protein|tara:strand:- start:18 stop:173 length:156 start_codon:yes stop_codon:yes gene_type:complete
VEFTVIYATGKEQKFHIRAVAEMYANIYGGRVVGKPQLELIVNKLVDKLAA